MIVTLTIDGKPVQAPDGTSVLEAALASGIDIPRLCYHPELSPSGGCRLCLVEVEGRPAPQASCGMRCEPGMQVRTQSDQLTRLRRDTLDLFLSDHPVVNGRCDHNGPCQLREYAIQYGLDQTSYEHELSRPMVQDDNPFFVRDHEMCILCGKCVRVCDEVVGANAIDYAGRGFFSHIATPFDWPMQDSSCVFCGSCVQVCPTASLVPRTRWGKPPECESGATRTICGYCGVGCSVEFVKEGSDILFARGFPEGAANGEFLCVKGRYGWDFAASPDRLTLPLVRRDVAEALGIAGEPAPQAAGFVTVSWDEAIELVSGSLAETIREHGPDAVASLASARCTNEENYLFQKLLRVGAGTNNVDHCARLCHSSSVSGLGMAFGSGAMTNPIRDIRDADCILITGSNTAESHPVISYEVVRAVRKGANLIIIDPRRVPMVEHATLFLQPRPGMDMVVFLAMAHVILREGWADSAFIESRTEGFDAFAQSVATMTPEIAALESGVPAQLIEEAARRYALGERAGQPTAERGRSSILYAMGITQRSNGTELVLSLANLAMLTGQIGKPSTGINPLRGQSNVQGACDVGALPNVLPGYRPVTDEAARRAAAAVWEVPELPARVGLTSVEMMHAAVEGTVRAMFIMGENPMLSDPDLQHVEEALRALDFLVVQDIFLSETARLAHVVLPAASWLEKDGTFTNTERRVQLIRPVVAAPGEALPDWQILGALGERLDAKLGQRRRAGYWRYPSTAAIMDELAAVTPSYGGIHHDRLAGEGLVWPCPDDSHPGTPILHLDRFTRGRGRFHAVTAHGPAEQPDAEYPMVLTTGRILYHYHTGTMTRRSEGLDWRESRGYAEVNAADAEAAGIRDGGPALLTSRRGQVRVQARVSPRVQPGVVFLSFHWKESPANLLTHDHSLDPIAMIPEYKVSSIRLEKAKGGAQRRAD